MNSEEKKTISDFVLKAKGSYSEGKNVPVHELIELNNKLTNPIPEWFIEMYSKFPLSGSMLDFDGYVTIELATLQNIYDEMEMCYPGIAIKDLGYFCIGIQAASSGDHYFTTSKLGDNPPVFQVYHDVSDEGAEIEKHGMEQIAESLSDFFTKARIIKKDFS
jgi:hypothetical protein